MQTDRRAEIDTALIRLHGDLDHAGELSALHEEAAEMMANDPCSRRFHLTHAWVFAMVDGDDDRAEGFEAELRTIGGL